MTHNEYNQEESINWRSYTNNILDIWYVFPISIAIFGALAYLYILKTPLSYDASSTLLIQSDVRYNYGTADEIMTGFGLLETQKKIENEIAILSSYSLAEKTILNTNNFIRYYKLNKLRKENIYTRTPFIVVVDSLKPQLTGIYKLDFIEDGQKIEIERKEGRGLFYDYISHDAISALDYDIDFSFITEFDKWINTKELNVKIIKNPLVDNNKKFSSNETYYFQLNTLNSLSVQLQRSLKAEPLDKQSDVIVLTLTHDNANEAVDLLNNLVEQFFSDNLAEKNKMAISTIEFIDNQLDILSDTLRSTESELESFRKRNKVINIEVQSSDIFSNIQKYESKLAMAKLRMKYFEYLKNYIQSTSDYSDILVPSIMDVSDVMLNKLISDLLSANAEKIKILSSSTPQNPLLNSINRQIEDIKKSITESINSLISSNEIEINDIESHIKTYETELYKIPGTERKLIGIERSFTINNEIYTYLLQKRAESSIAKASNMPDGKLIDPARRVLAKNITPKKKPVYIIFAIIGALLPLIYIVIKKMLFDYIEEKEDITATVDMPIIGTVPHSNLKTNFIVQNHPQSFISETFRTIRTGLQFMLDTEKSNTLLITSSISKDGKTFLSVNIAQAIAATNKKTLIIGLDLRSPGLCYDFYPKNDVGISTYLTGQSDIKESIQNTEDPYLDVLTSGPKPPNPSELIGSQKMKDLLNHLKEIYDFIIIDTPPINITSDALQIINNTDAVIYIVRYKHTKKRYLEHLKTLYSQNKIHKNVGIVLNDVKLNRFKGYYYGYSYKYGYDEKNKVKRFFSELKNLF